MRQTDGRIVVSLNAPYGGQHNTGVGKHWLANFSRKRTTFCCTSLTSSTRGASRCCSLVSSVSNNLSSSTLHTAQMLTLTNWLVGVEFNAPLDTLEWYWQTKQYRKIQINKLSTNQKSRQPKIQQNKTSLVQLPLTTLGQETRWAYSTMPLSSHGATLTKFLTVSLTLRSCFKALTITLLLLFSKKCIFIINCNVCYFNFILALLPWFYTCFLFLSAHTWFCYFQLYGTE